MAWPPRASTTRIAANARTHGLSRIVNPWAEAMPTRPSHTRGDTGQKPAGGLVDAMSLVGGAGAVVVMDHKPGRR